MRVCIPLLLIPFATASFAQDAPPGASFSDTPPGEFLSDAPPGAMACTGCHGLEPGSPYPITGLSPDEIAGAMAAYRSGEREATLMTRVALGFTDAEARAIADWFAARKETE